MNETMKKEDDNRLMCSNETQFTFCSKSDSQTAGRSSSVCKHKPMFVRFYVQSVSAGSVFSPQKGPIVDSVRSGGAGQQLCI